MFLEKLQVIQLVKKFLAVGPIKFIILFTKENGPNAEPV